MTDPERNSLRVLGKTLNKFGDSITLGTSGVQILALQSFQDDRGNLGVVEFSRDLKFHPERAFFSFGVPVRQQRGNHAHRECHQLLLCLGGTCLIELDTGHEKHQLLMDSPLYGLYIPPMVWSTQLNFSASASLFVLASQKYEESDYIRNHDDFLMETRVR